MIALVMGLVPFGIFMMINYILLVDDIIIKKIEFSYEKLSLYLKEKSLQALPFFGCIL